MQETNCPTWEDFRGLVEMSRGLNSRTLWRGQADPTWPLASVFERRVLRLHGGDRPNASQTYPYDGRYEGKFPRLYLREWRDKYIGAFAKASAGLRGQHPTKLNEYQWQALGRHFGLVTRLLDWTEKPYIAAFFALHDMLERTPWEKRWTTPVAVYRLQFQEEMFREGLRLVEPYVDELPRMHRQRSVFTTLESDECFELEGFCRKIGADNMLVRATLSDKAIRDGILDLVEHGIDHALLFPDLGGAAQSANLAVDLFEGL
jgi:FRG domain